MISIGRVILLTISLLFLEAHGKSWDHDFGFNTYEIPNKTVEYDEYSNKFSLDEPEDCARKCIPNQPPRICKYNFTVEEYYSMSKACYDCPFNKTDCFRKDCVPTNGVKKLLLTVNRQIPGPSIEVCQGDLIVVDVINRIRTQSTTIHWHGQHQKNYPYMDGVPYITQCPILPNSRFRYIFTADTVGTHFWHSHIGLQRGDGIYGSLIVRIPKEEDAVGHLYDYDLSSHIMNIIDWKEESLPDAYFSFYHGDGDANPTSILVNGLGRFERYTNENNLTTFTPTARFEVEKEKRYRFRLINAGMLNCPIEISVDNHTLTVISSDGHDFNPVEVTSIVTSAGERFDFIINANQDVDLYWIRFRGDSNCAEAKAFQVAVLEYKGRTSTQEYPLGTPTYETSQSQGIQINPLNIGTENNSSFFVTIPQLVSFNEWDDTLKTTPDYQFYVSYDFYTINDDNFHISPYYGYFEVTDPTKRKPTAQFNHISLGGTPFPLLPQRDQITADLFCNETTLKDTNCSKVFCRCTHVIQVALDSVVEIVFVDEGLNIDSNHPIHLHGFSFRVVSMERIGSSITVEDIKRRDKAGLVNRNLIDAPLKDVVTVPGRGYTIVRFKASNPGFWALHCHMAFHAEIGMAMIVKVGEHSDMLPVPENFPKCDNYLPSFP